MRSLNDEATPKVRKSPDPIPIDCLLSKRVETLFDRYGARAIAFLEHLPAAGKTMLHHLPDYSAQEITFLAKHERVARLEDVLLRRTAIALLGDATPPVISEIGRIVGAALDWTDQQIRDEVLATTQLLANRHVVRRI